MAILKGQNFRIAIYDSLAEEYKVIGMSTGCTATLTNNTDDSSHKDIVGAAAMPTVTNKSWSVSCESLSVSDVSQLLAAMKAMQPMTLMWDETQTWDNQARAKAAFARKGTAYLNDITFNFDDRTNSQKSLQFTGTGPLQTVGSSEVIAHLPQGSYTKGQFVRLFLSNDNNNVPSRVIAAARQLSLHVSLSMESATTKDTTGEWDVQEPTALNYDISTTALMRGSDNIVSSVGAQNLADIEAIHENATPVKWQIANVSGDNQRTKGSVIVSGSVILTQLTLNGPNRQNADYTSKMNGYGEYVVSA